MTQGNPHPIRPWSTFPSLHFTAGFYLEDVDPDQLPKPEDAQPGFSAREEPWQETKAQEDTWRSLARTGLPPGGDPYRATLIRLVTLAINAGLISNLHVLQAVCDALGLPDDHPQRKEHSALMSGVFYARKYLDDLKTMQQEVATWRALNLVAEQHLKPIRRGSKRINAVVVWHLTPPQITCRDGVDLAVTPAVIELNGKRGNLAIMIRTSAEGLRYALEDYQQHARRRKAG